MIAPKISGGAARQIALAVLMLCLAACAGQSGREELLLRTRITSNGPDFQADVIQMDDDRVRRLEIRCKRYCKYDLVYIEDDFDHLIAAFQPYQGVPHLYTIWGGGVAVVLRIYEVGEDRIRKIFEEPTRTGPDVVADENGITLILGHNNPAIEEEWEREPRYRLEGRGHLYRYRWEGDDTYKLINAPQRPN